MATQILVIFIIRTNGRPWSNRPHPALTVSSLLALAVAMILPFSPVAAWFGFRAPPLEVIVSVGLLVVAYLVCAELAKRIAVPAAPLMPSWRGVAPVRKPCQQPEEPND
jgi:Mg2+-importing ATPase